MIQIIFYNIGKNNLAIGMYFSFVLGMFIENDILITCAIAKI